MDYMFFSCKKLKYLNIASFNTQFCYSFDNIFNECLELQLYLNPNNCNNLYKYIPQYVTIHNITKLE